MLETLVVPLDGSDLATRAVAAADAIAGAADAGISLVGVASDDGAAGSVRDHLRDADGDDQRRPVARCRRPRRRRPGDHAVAARGRAEHGAVPREPRPHEAGRDADPRGRLAHHRAHDATTRRRRAESGRGHARERRRRRDRRRQRSRSAGGDGGGVGVAPRCRVAHRDRLRAGPCRSPEPRTLHPPPRSRRRPGCVSRVGAGTRRHPGSKGVDTVAIADPVSIAAGLERHLGEQSALLLVLGARRAGAHVTPGVLRELLRNATVPVLVVPAPQ